MFRRRRNSLPAPGETYREPAGGPRWRVQFGVFSKEANALRAKARLAGELADMLAADYLDIDDSKGGGLLRVVLAHADSNAAEDLCVELEARGRDCHFARASGPAP
ncbi:MAG: SPOR domain-containing protein [Nitrospinae bacterium]|nr:SPOR domain-containing protein [Nitrospinota bacterium]